jgi:internalin A
VATRDKDEMKHGDRITDFMDRIGEGDLVYVFLSDKYLKSPFCMYELHAIWRNSRTDEGEFQRRVRLYRLSDANIWTPLDRAKYARYWWETYQSLDKEIKETTGVLLGDEDQKAFRLMAKFALDIGNILYPFANRLQPKTFDQFLQYGFEGLPR